MPGITLGMDTPTALVVLSLGHLAAGFAILATDRNVRLAASVLVLIAGVAVLLGVLIR